MAERHALLIGTLPGETADEAMRSAVERVGPHLRFLPDGETGERRSWIVGLIMGLENHPDLEISKDGDFSDYRHQRNYRVRKGHQLTSDNLDLGYASWYRANREIFDKLVADTPELGGVSFQVGIPSDLDLAMFALGPMGGLRNRKVFQEATIRDITAIRDESGDDVLFQIEVPVETMLVALAGPFGRFVAPRVAASIGRTVARAPEGTRFGVHLCMGDLGHKALTRLRSLKPFVTLANTLSQSWPAGRPLEYVHMPLAAGEEPATLEESFYRPLEGLRLPADVHFVAGFLHEQRSIDEQRRILAAIETAVGHPVDIAAACGLGRRSPEAAFATMDQAKALCEAN